MHLRTDLQRRYQCHIARPIPNAPPPMYPAVCYYYSTSGTRLLAPPCARSAPPPTYPATKLYSVQYQELEVQFFGGLKLAPPTLQKSAPHLTSHWIIHSLVTRVILPSEITISVFQDRDVEEVQWICECDRTNIWWHKFRYSHICQPHGSVLTSFIPTLQPTELVRIFIYQALYKFHLNITISDGAD